MKKSLLSLTVAAASLVGQFSFAISVEEIPEAIKPRLMAQLITECDLDKKDNYIQFLNRMIVELGKSDKITPKFINSVAKQAVKKYKLAGKPSCVDLGVSLLESGILNQKSYRTLLPIKLKRDEAYMAAAYRGIIGDVTVSERRAAISKNNEEFEFAYSLSLSVRKSVLFDQSPIVVDDPRWLLLNLGTIKGLDAGAEAEALEDGLSGFSTLNGIN